MYLTSIEDDVSKYEVIKVGNKPFYKLKSSNDKNDIRKRRYSDQFKDPVFLARDTYRKLKMIENFRDKNGNLEEIIEKWKSCIGECIHALERDCNIPPVSIFMAFKLVKYGFKPDEYGINEDDMIKEKSEGF